MIEKITVQDAHLLFPDYDKRFILKEHYDIYALIEKNIPVSCLCVALEGRLYAKIHAAYTPKEYRKHGYFKKLLSNILTMYPDKIFKADCLPSSFGIFIDCGFVFLRKKHCKGYTLYKVERRLDKYGSTEKGN